jgi:hypothetical protein
MKLMQTATLILLAGTIAPGFAQRGPQEDRPDKGEERGKSEGQARPERQQGRSQPQQRAEPPGQQRGQPQGQPQHEQRAQWPREQPPHGQRAQQQPNLPPPQQRQEQPRRADIPQRAQAPQPAPVQRAQRGDPQGQVRYPAQQRTQQQAAAWQQQRGWAQHGAWQEHTTWQQNRAQKWRADHRTWDQRGGYGGYLIPEDRFRLYFGSQHWFRIQNRPIVVSGYPRFRYGDYWFMLVDPWPEYWADNWYAMDDVYIEYDNGYYLYNRRYPGVGLAIGVVF